MSYTVGVRSKFFEKIRQLFTVNPETNSGIPVVGTYRTPAPGSQPAPKARPTTKHSDVAQNYYYDRDTRRNYPQLAVFMQSDVAKLIAAANLKSLPASESETATKELAKINPETLSITDVIASAPKPLYSPDNLPPIPGPAPGTPRWRWKQSKDQFNDPDVYWPMKLYS